jgi:hypothetical protein
MLYVFSWFLMQLWHSTLLPVIIGKPDWIDSRLLLWDDPRSHVESSHPIMWATKSNLLTIDIHAPMSSREWVVETQVVRPLSHHSTTSRWLGVSLEAVGRWDVLVSAHSLDGGAHVRPTVPWSLWRIGLNRKMLLHKLRKMSTVHNTMHLPWVCQTLEKIPEVPSHPWKQYFQDSPQSHHHFHSLDSDSSELWPY